MAPNVFLEILVTSYELINLLFLDPNKIDYTDDEIATLFFYNGNFSVVDSSIVLGWDKSTPICFLIHGWKYNSQTGLMANLAQAYFDKRLCNVISVDWGKRANTNIQTTLKNIRIVGDYLGQFFVDIIGGGYPVDKISLIGHSFGAHVAGFAGKFVRSKTHHCIDSITGLDPALPFFWLADSSDRLDKGDANFVSTISTNSFILGTFWEWGHVSFIANSGVFQPVCLLENTPLISKAQCSHEYSVQIQINLIEDPFLYTATPCIPWLSQNSIYIRYNTTRDITGYYCFKT